MTKSVRFDLKKNQLDFNEKTLTECLICCVPRS